MKKVAVHVSITLVLLSFFSLSYAANDSLKKEEKKEKLIYTQKDFDKKVEQQVYLKLAKVTGASLEEFAKSLLKKEKELANQALELKQKKEELVLVEKSFATKMKNFREGQDRIIGCVDKNKKNANKRIDHIVQVMSGMKPANAAQVLAVQDSNISVQIISKLKPEKVSKIFNLMDKEISARLQKEYINMKR